MSAKEKSPWLLRLELLKSLTLKAVAEEVNERRLRALNDLLADMTQIKAEAPRTSRPGGADQFARLRKLVESQGWPLYSLPSDMRADAARMKRCVLALHSLLGNQRCRQLSDAQIATEMCVSDRTARRAVQDCREAFLVDVAETYRAPVKGGGRAENGFLLIWPTLADLAQDTRAPSLFDPTLPAEMTRGNDASEPALPSGHNGQPSGHNGQLPGHNGLVRDTARAPSFPISSNPSSSSPGPKDRADQEGEEDWIFQDPDWQAAYRKLAGYPVSDAVRALKAARQRGWQASQVIALIDDCVVKSIGEIRAWHPGQVWWQLAKGAPGSRITMQPCEEFRRAARDRDLELAKKRQARAVEVLQPARKSEDLEARLGRILDDLSPDQLRDLAAAGGPQMLQRFRSVGKDGMRTVLLIQLAKPRKVTGRDHCIELGIQSGLQGGDA